MVGLLVVLKELEVVVEEEDVEEDEDEAVDEDEDEDDDELGLKTLLSRLLRALPDAVDDAEDEAADLPVTAVAAEDAAVPVLEDVSLSELGFAPALAAPSSPEGGGVSAPLVPVVGKMSSWRFLSMRSCLPAWRL